MKRTIILLTLCFSYFILINAQDDPYANYPWLHSEGKRWVNEKVIINHGDTTCQYYNYEFKGSVLETELMEPKELAACYYFTGDELSVENDSLIADFFEVLYYNYDLGSWVHCVKNDPFRKLMDEGRILFRPWMYTDGGSRLLYVFQSAYTESPTTSFWYGLTGYYMDTQLEPFLTEENFTEVNSIDIDGYQAKRWAYVGEQGDTLAYVVEGIGFDSRDMGDLLTPFTRKPDPNADYQEWCGLSHVIKDGKIIYKGMRYRNENLTRIDEVVAEQPRRPQDDNYYNLMGQPVGKDVPTAPGIYIHHGQKICVSRTR